MMTTNKPTAHQPNTLFGKILIRMVITFFISIYIFYSRCFEIAILSPELQEDMMALLDDVLPAGKRGVGNKVTTVI